MQTSITSSTGTLLRGWRQRRGMSQLDVAAGADSSTRHVSFIETGRLFESEFAVQITVRDGLIVRYRLLEEGHGLVVALTP